MCGVSQAMCNLTVGTRGNRGISDRGETERLASVSGGTTGKPGRRTKLYALTATLLSVFFSYNQYDL